MAYGSNESGQFAVYIAPISNASDEKWPISSGYGFQHAWSRDSRKLFYRGEHAMMSVSIDADPESAGIPERIFEDTYFTGSLGRHFDVAEDGRFLMIKRDPDETGTRPPREIIVVRNWIEELKARVPVP